MRRTALYSGCTEKSLIEEKGRVLYRKYIHSLCMLTESKNSLQSIEYNCFCRKYIDSCRICYANARDVRVSPVGLYTGHSIFISSILCQKTNVLHMEVTRNMNSLFVLFSFFVRNDFGTRLVNNESPSIIETLIID